MRSRGMRRTLVWAVLAAMVVAAPATVLAQRGWDALPTVLSSVPVAIIIGGQGPRIVTSGAGDAVSAWTEVTAPNGVRIVRTARYEKAGGGWTPASTLFSNITLFAQDLDLAGDANGNAIAVWTAVSASLGNPMEFAVASFYAAASGAWTDIPLPVTNHSATPVVAMNPAGDAVIAWRELLGVNAGLHAVRYAHASATWSGDERPAGASSGAALFDAAIDDGANIHLVWRGAASIQSARFSAAGAAWGSVVNLGPYTNSQVVEPHVAVNGVGDAVATWESGGGIQAVLRSRSDQGWSAPSPIASGSGLDEFARPAIDPSGAVVVAWRRTGTSGAFGLQARRYQPGSGWSPIADLVDDAGQLPPSVAVAMDAAGNAFVVASRFVTAFADARLLAARYAVSTGAWTTTRDLTPAQQFAVLSDVAVDPAGDAVAVWLQSSGVQTTQVLRWDATPPVPSIAALTSSPGTLSVSLGVPASTDPALAPTNLEYSLDGGSSWIPRAPAGIASPLVVPTMNDVVTYSLRVRAVNRAGAGRVTDPLAARSGSGGTPSALRVVSVVGDAVTLAWATPTAGIDASDYLLEAGIAPLQTVATVRLGSPMTIATVRNAPAGMFYLRLTAINGAVRGGTSNEVRVVVGLPEVPAAPTGLIGLVNGSALTLSWTNTMNGGPPSSLLLNVSGAVSGSIPLPVSESFSFANVPPGTYTFTVAAVNATGTSAPTTAVTLSFPGSCTGVPNPPPAVSGLVVGNVVSLAWEAPQSGPAVSGYELVVTGAFAGRVPVSVRTISAAIDAGLYRIGVAATNACGSSASTAPITFVVP